MNETTHAETGEFDTRFFAEIRTGRLLNGVVVEHVKDVMHKPGFSENMLIKNDCFVRGRSGSDIRGS